MPETKKKPKTLEDAEAALSDAEDERDEARTHVMELLAAIRRSHDSDHGAAYMWCSSSACVLARELSPGYGEPGLA